MGTDRPLNYQLTNRTNCGDKRAYPTQREASEANNRHLRALKNKREKLHVYKCLNCRQWHLGHAPRKAKNGTRKKDTDRHYRLSDEY